MSDSEQSNSDKTKSGAGKACNGCSMSEQYEPGLVSVIIPTHNRAEMLKRAIRSVLNQTYKNFELIVICDGSKEHTEEVVESFNDPRIRFLKHETARGASAARNTGIRTARGEYIAFLDDDDEWTPNKLEVQVPAIENSGPEVGLVYAWMEYFHDGELVRKWYPKLKGYIFPEMLDNQAIGGCPTIMIKRNVIGKVGYFDETLPRGNDGNFMRRITKHFEVDYVPDVLARIHIGHEGRISENTRENLKAEIYAYERRLEYFREDFEKHPHQQANVLAKVAMSSFGIGEIRKGLASLSRMFRTKTSLFHKCKLLYLTVRGFIVLVFRDVLNSRQARTS
ncbi:glycosyltransferase family 2 protein [Planctomycetota bacterium]